jgi:glycosyltransferase involved in cell wall biosynthesis
VTVNLVRFAHSWIYKRDRRRKTKAYGVEFHDFVERHFDPDFYLSSNSDVAKAGHNALRHWVNHGLREERIFSPDLTVRLVSPDIQRDPQLTYINFGARLLEVRERQGLPATVLGQVMAQAQHEPIILGPGALALPNLPIQSLGKATIDLDAIAPCIEAKPRVVFVIPLLTIGGAEKYAADICRVFQDRGVGPIAVIVTDQKEKDSAGWRELSIVEPFCSAQVLFWRDACSTHADPHMLASLLAYLEPEFIIVTYSGICLQAITRYGKRLSQQSRIFCSYFNLGKDGLGAPYGVTFARFTTPFATSITDNKRAAIVLDRRFDALGKPAAVIPPRAPMASRETFERRLAGRTSQPVQGQGHDWVWVSRLDKEKGLDVLRRLAELRPGDVFDLYGPAPVPLDQLGMDLPNIRYRGILNDISLADFSAYRGFLFTSPLEGMPNVVLEMSQHAIPLIISNAGGLPETFDDTSAIIVPTGQDVEATAHGFDTGCDRLIAMSPAATTTLVKSAHEAVLVRHSADVFQACVRDVFGV